MGIDTSIVARRPVLVVRKEIGEPGLRDKVVAVLDEGTTKYDVQLPAFDENGGLQRIRHDEPTMFLARNHPASMRFVKKFWDWVRDARDYVRSRLG